MNEHAMGTKTITPLHASEKATGKACYAGDVKLRDTLVGKCCRSPFPHARILSIDTSRAERLPGVKLVITAKDCPKERIGRWVFDRPVLAEGKVRHLGEAVAAVAAVDEDTAQKAVKLIKVEYEELPVAANALEAMKPGAPLVHEDLAGYKVAGPKPNGGGNVLYKARIRAGDVEKALAQAAVVHHESYSTHPVHQGFTQPHQVVAATSPGGKMTLWDSTKAPFVIRKTVAETLGLPMARVRVIATRVGGDFGGKGTAGIEPICALLALKTGMPVKMALNFEEELTATFIRTASHIDITSGATKDGLLVALKIRMVFDIGAYNDSIVQHSIGYNLVQGPYSAPNVDTEVNIVYSNNTPTGHCRAPRGPQQGFAIESNLDGLARKLGIDPLEFRRRNAVKSGAKLPGGGVVGRMGLEQTMAAAGKFIKSNSPGQKVAGEGWGVACTWWGMHKVGEEGSPSSSWVKMNEDGTVTLFTGCTEQGGGQHDILVDIVAGMLDIPREDIAVIAADTDSVPYERGTGGSQTTYRVGTSVRLAAEDARNQLLALAAHRLKAGQDALQLKGGRVFVRGSTDSSVSLASLCAEAITSERGPVVGIGEDLREQRLVQSREDKELLDGLQTGTHAVKLAVDRETGKVTILKYFASHDVGFALNRRNVEGQIEGGVVCGLGYALSEELKTEQGRTLNTNLRDYCLPRSGDTFQIEKDIVEVPSKYGPYGARGIGEPSSIVVAAAISNAICDAVGVRLTDLPLSKGKVFAALNQKS